MFAVTLSAMLVVLTGRNVFARAWIDGISGTSFAFTAGAGEVSTPDGNSIHFWGYHAPGSNPAGVPQYPGPTLILQEDVPVTITLTSALPFGQCTSIVFPGHIVTATGGRPGVLARESCGTSAAETVEYTFTPTEPGTYTYYSGTQMELQVEMGLVGTIIVRPGVPEQAYNHADTYFDHEYLFMLTSMAPAIHQLANMGKFDQIDMSTRWPVYWFINGRGAPDDLAEPFVGYLPHQPYNCTPRMTPGQRILVRIIGGDQDQHPLHLHGNHFYEIARDGRMLASNPPTSGPDLKRGHVTALSVPGQTVDAIFEWTGENLGWDIYGTPADNRPAHNCIDVAPADGYADAGSDYPMEWCGDHNKPLPVALPENQDLAFGGWWSGSPFMGDLGDLPPGEGGLNPFGGFFFMWHSHAEKELTNFDIFPGGMMSMMVVEPPGTPIDSGTAIP